ncbi:MAG: methyltransferase domain-containing protein [Pirellulaceae bacterium]
MKCLAVAQSRIREPEIMDDPALEGSRHEAALRGLSRLNYVSGSAGPIGRRLAALSRQLGRRHLRVLDVATGAGDVPLRLWRRARRAGLELEIHGVDVSQRAVEFATARAAVEQAAIRYDVLDVLAGPLPGGFDVVTCSLFLHHLDEDQGVALLQAMAQASKHLVVVSDLCRSAAGLALAHVAAWTLSRSDVVRVDAVRSVRAALTPREVAAWAHAAGLQGAVIQRHWPFRFLLSWRRS